MQIAKKMPPAKRLSKKSDQQARLALLATPVPLRSYPSHHTHHKAEEIAASRLSPLWPGEASPPSGRERL